MPNLYTGEQKSRGGRFAVVVSRYNEFVTKRLLDGAVETLIAGGVPEANIDVAWTPGAFEIPVTAGQMAESGMYAAVLCLGAVIRGETTHDQHISRSVSHFIAEISVHTGVPVLFGVLTCDTVEQAINRSGGTKGNKGVECAQAAMEMVSLLRKLPGARPK